MNDYCKWLIRKWINRLCDGIWSFTATSWPARPAQPATLIIAPHPDDDVFGCAGLILSRTLKKEKLHILYLTDGSASHPGHPLISPGLLAARRREESGRAGKILGLQIQDLYYLGLPDGKLDHLDSDHRELLAQKIGSLLRENGYDEIYLPLHCDGSAEHEAAYRLIRPALPSSLRVYEYPIWSRWTAWRLFSLFGRPFHIHQLSCSGFHSKKVDAINCHLSQIQPAPPWTKSVLPEGFASLFLSDREFFFLPYESSSPH